MANGQSLRYQVAILRETPRLTTNIAMSDARGLMQESLMQDA